MKKLWKAVDGYRGEGHEEYLFDCPGCGMMHAVPVKRGSRAGVGPAWDFNGSLEAPTFHPSLLVRYHDQSKGPGVNSVCHLFVTDGMLQFLSDCTHALAGQTVSMEEVP